MPQIFYHQGDVPFFVVDALPEGEQEELAPDNRGRFVLALGEVTGHAHIVKDVQVRWIKVAGETYLVSPRPFEVRHVNIGDDTLSGDHDTLTLPDGVTRVDVQVSDHEEPRQVID